MCPVTQQSDVTDYI